MTYLSAASQELDQEVTANFFLTEMLEIFTHRPPMSESGLNQQETALFLPSVALLGPYDLRVQLVVAERALKADPACVLFQQRSKHLAGKKQTFLISSRELATQVLALLSLSM